MTLADLQLRYHELSVSSDPRLKAKAKGFLELIQLYRTNCNAYESEPVKISMIAEEYVKSQDKLYQVIKKDEYKQKVQAGLECIITYSTPDEIARYISEYKGNDVSLANYLNYMKGAGYMDKTKYADFVSAYDLLLL